MTDVDGITTLLDRARDQNGTDRDPIADADLLRQLVYLPNATVIVALQGRRVVGAALLALRPSVVHGGLVGTIDLMAVEPELREGGVGGAVLAEIIRSARNKGCVEVEAEPGSGEAGLWQGWGFGPSEPRLRLELAAAALRT